MSLSGLLLISYFKFYLHLHPFECDLHRTLKTMMTTSALQCEKCQKTLWELSFARVPQIKPLMVPQSLCNLRYHSYVINVTALILFMITAGFGGNQIGGLPPSLSSALSWETGWTGGLKCDPLSSAQDWMNCIFKPTNQSIFQPPNQSINHPTNQLTNLSTNQPTNQLTNLSTIQPTNQKSSPTLFYLPSLEWWTPQQGCTIFATICHNGFWDPDQKSDKCANA